MKHSNEDVFRDKEVYSFYKIEVGISAFVAILAAVQRELPAFGIATLIAFGFLCCGPPLKAEVLDDGSIVFKGPVRRTRVTRQTLKKVKAIGANDYRAHVVLRNKWGFPVMYRNRNYTNAPQLATIVLELIDNAPQAKVSKDALKLLKLTAKGKTKPL